MLSRIDKEIISLVSRDIPLTKRPFKDLAGRLGIDEGTILGRIKFFKKKGLMRKFTASLNHRKMGFSYNAMVVWDVPEKLIDKAGSIMASFDEVSHCYRRKGAPGWDYNLYSMIHGKTKKKCFGVIKKILDSIGANIDRRVLFSSKEEKKTGAKLS